MLFSTRKVAPKINQRISVLCLEEKAVAAEYHNNVQLNSPETVRPQDTFLFGYAQLRNNWRGCCPPITASNNQKRIGQLALFVLLQLQLSIGFLHRNFG